MVFNGGIRGHFRLRELNVSENKSQESWHIVGLREDGNRTHKTAYYGLEGHVEFSDVLDEAH